MNVSSDEFRFVKSCKHDNDEWNRIVAASSQGTVYHDSRWLEAVKRLTGDDTAIYVAIKDGAIAAGFSLQIRHRGPLAIATRPYATPYSGVIVNSKLDPALRARLIEGLARFSRRFSHIVLTAAPFGNALENDLPWRHVRRSTYLLRSCSLNEMWRNLSSEVRNRVRKAEKHGVIVAKEWDTRGFFDIYKGVFARQRRKVLISGHSFEKFFGDIATRNLGNLYTARLNDRTLCAACLILNDAKRAYYSLAASEVQLRNTGASSLLVWEVLRDVIGAGIEFDFGGANVPHVAQFKSKFRGTLTTYPEVDNFRSVPERLAIELWHRLR